MSLKGNLYLDGQLIAEKAVVSWSQDVKVIGEIHVPVGTELHPATHYELAFADGGILKIVFPSIPIPSKNDGWIKFKPIHWAVEP